MPELLGACLPSRADSAAEEQSLPGAMPHLPASYHYWLYAASFSTARHLDRSGTQYIKTGNKLVV